MLYGHGFKMMEPFTSHNGILATINAGILLSGYNCPFCYLIIFHLINEKFCSRKREFQEFCSKMGIIDNKDVQLQECLGKTNWVVLHFTFPYVMSGGHCSRKGSTVR